MDYNQNQNNYQYYSPNNSSPEQPEKTNPFSIASLVCGIASILLCCTGVLSLPLGALGVLFAILSKRMGRSMSPLGITGIVLSCTGMVFGLVMCAYVVYLVLTDADYRQAFEDSYNQYYNQDYNEDYDEDYDDYLNDYFNGNLDEYFDGNLDEYFDGNLDEYFDDYFKDYDDGTEENASPFTVTPL